MRIVFLGDSLTWGGYGGNYIPYIANQLPEHTIINAGVAGDTVINLLNRLESVLETHQPDAIFVMVGGNDAVSYSMPATRNYYRRAKNIPDGMITPEQFVSTYRELLLQIQLQFVHPLIGLAPTEYSRQLIETKRLYNNLIQELADLMNIPALDLDRVFTPDQPIEREPVTLKFIQEIGARASSGWSDYASERDKWGYHFTFDGMHLMPDTAPLFANQIVPFLTEHLLT